MSSQPFKRTAAAPTEKGTSTWDTVLAALNAAPTSSPERDDAIHTFERLEDLSPKPGYTAGDSTLGPKVDASIATGRTVRLSFKASQAKKPVGLEV